MEFHTVYHWLVQSERRKSILASFDQPLTATQVARRNGIALDACLHLLRGLTLYGVLYCLNADTRYNRLHGLTALGKACQRRLRREAGLRPITYRFPDVPWDRFSSVCYRHRSAVLKAMDRPMQAVAIKRKAVFQNPHLRMSANNTRDVMRYLLDECVVRKADPERGGHPIYDLTDHGRAFRELLLGARAF